MRKILLAGAAALALVSSAHATPIRDDHRDPIRMECGLVGAVNNLSDAYKLIITINANDDSIDVDYTLLDGSIHRRGDQYEHTRLSSTEKILWWTGTLIQNHDIFVSGKLAQNNRNGSWLYTEEQFVRGKLDHRTIGVCHLIDGERID